MLIMREKLVEEGCKREMKLERRWRGLSTFCPLQSFCLHPSSPLFSFLLAMPFNIPSPKHLSVFFFFTFHHFSSRLSSLFSLQVSYLSFLFSFYLPLPPLISPLSIPLYSPFSSSTLPLFYSILASATPLHFLTHISLFL